MYVLGVCMCLEVVWGIMVQTLNCVGYDYNWVCVYKYVDDVALFLLKGTILYFIGYFNNLFSNLNVFDLRNWLGLGYCFVDNMFINLMQVVYLDDEEFVSVVVECEVLFESKGGLDIGCVLCGLEDELEMVGGNNNNQKDIVETFHGGCCSGYGIGVDLFSVDSCSVGVYVRLVYFIGVRRMGTE